MVKLLDWCKQQRMEDSLGKGPQVVGLAKQDIESCPVVAGVRITTIRGILGLLSLLTVSGVIKRHD